MTTIEEIVDVVSKMTEVEQREILALVKRRKLSAGLPLEVLIARSRKINADPADLDIMEKAINEAFEQIDEDNIEPFG